MIPSPQMWRIKTPTGGIKFFELLMNFITLMLMRHGGSSVKNYTLLAGTNFLITGTKVDGVILGCLVVAGFFYFNLLQIVSILMGDESHVLNVIHSWFGFVLFLSCGAVTVDAWSGDLAVVFPDNGAPLALGAFAIMTSFVYLADGIVSLNAMLRKE